jgi:hypothetical protein
VSEIPTRSGLCFGLTHPAKRAAATAIDEKSVARTFIMFFASFALQVFGICDCVELYHLFGVGVKGLEMVTGFMR